MFFQGFKSNISLHKQPGTISVSPNRWCFFPFWRNNPGYFAMQNKKHVFESEDVSVYACVLVCVMYVTERVGALHFRMWGAPTVFKVRLSVLVLKIQDHLCLLGQLRRERKKKSSSEARQVTLFLSVQCRCTGLSLANQWNPRGLIRHWGMSAKSLWSADLHPLCSGNNTEEWSMFACF